MLEQHFLGYRQAVAFTSPDDVSDDKPAGIADVDRRVDVDGVRGQR